jgi:uncharacterized protein (DUF1499 family)
LNQVPSLWLLASQYFSLGFLCFAWFPPFNLCRRLNLKAEDLKLWKPVILERRMQSLIKRAILVFKDGTNDLRHMLIVHPNHGVIMVTRLFLLGSLLVVVAAAILMILSGPGTRLDWWDFRMGLTLFRYGATVGLIGGVACLISGLLNLRKSRGVIVLSLVGAMIGLSIFATGLSFRSKVESLPYIHDITTDTEDPPAFFHLLNARGGALNPPEYPGAEVAQQQMRAYPDIQPIITHHEVEKAFEMGLSALQNMGLQVAAADSQRLTIEATDTTRWFGFKDDMIVRVQETENGKSRIDVRSKSRVGISDVGANAERIRRFIAVFSDLK